MRTAAVALALALAAPALGADPAPATEQDKTVYALGLKAAESFAELGLSAQEVKLVTRAIADALTPGARPAVSLADYDAKVQKFAQERIATGNKAYLEKVAREKGAQKTPSGLVYFVVKEGSGPSPAESGSASPTSR